MVKQDSTKPKPRATQEPPKETPAAQPQPVAASPTSKGINVGQVFWGLLLVVIGGLLLLGNLGVVQVEWGNIWRLWPLAIIAAGLSLLSVRHWLWQVVIGVFVVIALLAVVFFSTGDYDYMPSMQTRHVSVEKISSDVTDAEVGISAGASRVRINTSDSETIATAKLESNHARLTETSTRTGNTQRINFSAETDDGWWMMGGMKSEWDVSLTRRLPLSVTLDAGASHTDADLSQAQLRSLVVKAGASNLQLTLGNKSTLTKVKIESGASSIVVRVPKSSGVKLNIDGGLTSRNLADLRLVSEDNYQTDQFDLATHKIEITADVGLASFTIEQY